GTFNFGVVNGRDDDGGGTEERRVGDRSGERLVIDAVVGAAAEGVVDRQRGSGAASAADGEGTSVTRLRRVGIRRNHGDRWRGRRLVVVGNGHRRAAGRADSVGRIGREREHDRLGTFNFGVVNGRDDDGGGTGAGRNRDRTGETLVIDAVVGAAAEGVVD